MKKRNTVPLVIIHALQTKKNASQGRHKIGRKFLNCRDTVPRSLLLSSALNPTPLSTLFPPSPFAPVQGGGPGGTAVIPLQGKNTNDNNSIEVG